MNDWDLERVIGHQTDHSWQAYPAWRVRIVPPPPPPYRRILVVDPSSIGDVLCATIPLEALREAYPEARIAWIVEEEAAEAVRGGAADEIIVPRRRRWATDAELARRELPALREQIRAFGADYVINPHLAPRSAWYSRIAAPPERLTGLSIDDDGVPLQRVSPWFIRHLRQLPHPRGLPNALSPIGLLNRMFDCRRPHGRIRIALTAADRAVARQALAAAGLEAGRPYAVLHTGSNEAARRWRREHWPTLAERITRETGLAVVWFGGPDDVERVAWCAARTATPTHAVAGKLSLRESAAVLAGARALVSPDTSAVHLAAAGNLPVLILTGPRWVGSQAAKCLVLSGQENDWCRQITPELALGGFRFILGLGDPPVPPPTVSMAWTGDQAPGEFFRGAAAAANAEEYVKRRLALAYENVWAGSSAEAGYRDLSLAESEMREAAGPQPDGLEPPATTWRRSLESFMNECRRGRSSLSRLADRSFSGETAVAWVSARQALNDPFWWDFFQPFSLNRSEEDKHRFLIGVFERIIREGKKILAGLAAVAPG